MCELVNKNVDLSQVTTRGDRGTLNVVTRGQAPSGKESLEPKRERKILGPDRGPQRDKDVPWLA